MRAFLIALAACSLLAAPASAQASKKHPPKRRGGEVRRIHNDVTFVDTFLTPDFCRRYQLFSFKHNDQNETYEIESREFKKIKDRLLFGLTNFGQPIIRVKDGNYRNRGELYLQHEHFGIDLKLDHAQDTLRHLNRLWTRPVHI